MVRGFWLGFVCPVLCIFPLKHWTHPETSSTVVVVIIIIERHIKRERHMKSSSRNSQHMWVKWLHFISHNSTAHSQFCFQCNEHAVTSTNLQLKGCRDLQTNTHTVVPIMVVSEHKLPHPQVPCSPTLALHFKTSTTGEETNRSQLWASFRASREGPCKFSHTQD